MRSNETAAKVRKVRKNHFTCAGLWAWFDDRQVFEAGFDRAGCWSEGIDWNRNQCYTLNDMSIII